MIANWLLSVARPSAMPAPAPADSLRRSTASRPSPAGGSAQKSPSDGHFLGKWRFCPKSTSLSPSNELRTLAWQLEQKIGAIARPDGGPHVHDYAPVLERRDDQLHFSCENMIRHSSTFYELGDDDDIPPTSVDVPDILIYETTFFTNGPMLVDRVELRWDQEKEPQIAEPYTSDEPFEIHNRMVRKLHFMV